MKAEENLMGMEMMEAGWLSILPPLIAITLALITKEVYSSLFLGVFSGMCVYCLLCGGNILQAITYFLPPASNRL